ncbi:right-handed parallel beta-helix repeat-containing protein [Cerasicoccus arenae]|nr:right-handed parallel beta-helix repeat-containing protein [Cerasicoccus arenae]MBK1857113.1 right-handed parallel beta-helix repeat-containing protein [Cerasicoccus arenae]
MKILKCFSIFMALAGLLHGDNLIKNNNFTGWVDGKPASWTDRSKQDYSPLPNAGGMQVKIVREKNSSGEVLQKIPVEPGKRYRIAGEVECSTPGLGFIQVKRYAGGKEIDRINTGNVKGEGWTPVEKIFKTEGVDYIEVLLRWKQKSENMGSTISFRNLSLETVPPLTYNGEEVPPRAVPTFNSIGLYWKPNGGTASRSVTAEYRKKGTEKWNEAMPLWFDAADHPAAAASHTAEYRGSIVYLDAGTTYEVKLQLENGPTRIFDVNTWDENFKIARTVKLPKEYSETYVIEEGGNEADGYVLYEAEEGSVWDANDVAPSNIQINASWVIVRGLTLKGAKTHGIVLGAVNHIVIEHCDISGWGETRDSGQAKNLNSAIYSGSTSLEHIVVQNCELHDPRSDSNSWNQQRPGTKSKHPEGPQAITFRKGKGHYVIRYNNIYSDMDHMFNDSMGEFANFSFAGFPNRDTDIYDNFVSHCWDDGLEIEGANMNVRVWNNYLDMTYGALGGASTSLGPVYFFRNVYAVSRKHEGTESNDYRGHYLLKIGNKNQTYTQGKTYVFHNTILQPPAFEGFRDPSSGGQSGIVFTDKRNHQENITSRNNILQMRKDKDWAIRDVQLTASGDYDYDLYNGRMMAREGSQTNGIVGAPVYERAPDGRLWLAPDSLGYDAGARIPNFNDDYTGKAPDIGAVERDSKAAKPKLWPAFPENYQPPVEEPAIEVSAQ